MLHSLAWFQGRDKKVFRTFYFALLNGRSRIDVFRADFGAVAHESTAPYAVLAVQLRHTLLLTVVAAIFVITMRQRNGSRTDELWVQAKLRARGVAQTTVDATGELVILRHLRRGLDVSTLIRGAELPMMYGLIASRLSMK